MYDSLCPLITSEEEFFEAVDQPIANRALNNHWIVFLALFSFLLSRVFFPLSHQKKAIKGNQHNIFSNRIQLISKYALQHTYIRRYLRQAIVFKFLPSVVCVWFV